MFWLYITNLLKGNDDLILYNINIMYISRYDDNDSLKKKKICRKDKIKLNGYLINDDNEY